MKQQTKIWVFRILFILAIIYHIWSYFRYGGIFNEAGALYIFGREWLSGHVVWWGYVGSFLIFIFFNGLNYLIQVGLPIYFFYRGWIKK